MPFSYLSNVENIPFSWFDSGSPKAIERHRAQLEKLHREGKRAWIRLDAISTTRFWLNFNDYTFLNTDSQQGIQAQIRDWLKPSGKEFDRIYLLAEENASEPCYDITKYIWDCLQGDLDVASRLRGRTVFRIHQIEKTSAHDFLSRTVLMISFNRLSRGTFMNLLASWKLLLLDLAVNRQVFYPLSGRLR